MGNERVEDLNEANCLKCGGLIAWDAEVFKCLNCGRQRHSALVLVDPPKPTEPASDDDLANEPARGLKSPALSEKHRKAISAGRRRQLNVRQELAEEETEEAREKTEEPMKGNGRRKRTGLATGSALRPAGKPRRSPIGVAGLKEAVADIDRQLTKLRHARQTLEQAIEVLEGLQ